MGTHQLFQHFALFGQNVHRLGGQQGHSNLPSLLWIHHATTPAIRLLVAGATRLPFTVSAHLHQWTRHFCSAELVVEMQEAVVGGGGGMGGGGGGGGGGG